MRNFSLLILSIFISVSSFAQSTITGVVSSATEGPLIGATILVKGTTSGTVSDFDGSYSLNVPEGHNTLVFSYIGYSSMDVNIDGRTTVDVVLAVGELLEEVVVTGNRAKPRTVLDSPVPIDNISAKQLAKSGKTHVEQMLNYKVPSFSSANQAISDATAHFDPADLRGLGPSRTLVLVNGKRKNAASQIYLNGTPGKGEVGTDLKSIPSGAIKSIEVLRDGASAQYGSDAVAGVINIILKDKSDGTTVNTSSGITSQGDGFNFGMDVNSNVSIGKGNLNFTLEYYDQKLTNRAGSPGIKDTPKIPELGDYEDKVDENGTVINTADELFQIDLTKWNSYNANYTEVWDNWATKNPQLGMIVGQPDLTKKSFMVNGSIPINENSEFYTFHGYTSRYGRSFAYYRAPYWRPDVESSEFYNPEGSFEGYHPTFETEIQDNINCVGFRTKVSGWNIDASAIYGRNYVDYTVKRSVNRDYLKKFGWSPREFHPGGYEFNNVIGNLDFTKVFSDMVSGSFGLEIKRDAFIGHQGDFHSYWGGGSDSFAGIKPEEAVNTTRNSKAAYAGLDFDISEAFLIGVAGRFEDFSDFGNNFSYKVNARYKIMDNFALRAAYSTGFRAPSLHQRYIQLSQYIIVEPNPDPQLQGTFPNNHPAVVGFGVPNLFAETSQNITGGLTFKISNHASLTADIYNIKVKDRVLFSSQQGYKQDEGDIDLDADGKITGSELLTDINPVEQILVDNGLKALQFFVNAVNTKTLGADIVFNMHNISAGAGKFGLTFAGNMNKTEIDGKVANPKLLEDNGYKIFDRREAGRITDARPKSKFMLGLDYDLGSFNISLNNTRFGEVTVFDSSEESKDQVHSAKIITDLLLGYSVSDNASLTFTANNIFDVYPDILDENLRSAGGRFLYSSEVTQMGFMGTTFKIGLNVNF